MHRLRMGSLPAATVLKWVAAILLQASGICATTRTSDLYRPSPAIAPTTPSRPTVAGFEQHGPLLEGDRRQMRQQPIEVIARQRGEQLVVQGKTGVRDGYCHCDILPGRSGRFTAGVGGRSERAIRGKLMYRDKEGALSV